MEKIELHHILKAATNSPVGVNIEAYSIEDEGKLKFNVFIYNVQSGIFIDYATGANELIQ